MMIPWLATMIPTTIADITYFIYSVSYHVSGKSVHFTQLALEVSKKKDPLIKRSYFLSLSLSLSRSFFRTGTQLSYNLSSGN